MSEALGTADRQHHRAGVQFTHLVSKAHRLLAEHDDTVAWALLTTEIVRQLDLAADRGPHFAGDMLAAAAIRVAKLEEVSR